MTLVEILTIVALFSGPAIGVYLARKLRQADGERERQLEIFKTLMATRAATLSINHVEALNRIDLEFNDRSKDKHIQEAWGLYSRHLGNAANPEDERQWIERREDLLVKLLSRMAQRLGYGEFDESNIRDSGYYPQGYNDHDWEIRHSRQLLLEVLKEKKAFPVKITHIADQTSPKVHQE